MSAAQEIRVGSLLAVANGEGAWLYRVIGETPKRWLVEIVERPTKYSWRHVTRGHRTPYFEKANSRLIVVRDMDHFEAIKVAKLILDEAESTAKDIYRAACEAARAKYEESIA